MVVPTAAHLTSAASMSELRGAPATRHRGTGVGRGGDRKWRSWTSVLREVEPASWKKTGRKHGSMRYFEPAWLGHPLIGRGTFRVLEDGGSLMNGTSWLDPEWCCLHLKGNLPKAGATPICFAFTWRVPSTGGPVLRWLLLGNMSPIFADCGLVEFPTELLKSENVLLKHPKNRVSSNQKI